jgi:hypothetical protein
MTEIPYAHPDTIYGVLTERLPDGGVTITVPDRGMRGFLARFLHSMFGSFPHRAVITLSRDGLRIVEPGNSESNDNPIERSWPLAEVGEIRPNRYSRGVYVSIPGKDNFDILQDVTDRIVKYVGEALAETLVQLKSKP